MGKELRIFLMALFCLSMGAQAQSGVKPTPSQIEWHELEFTSLIHFGPNTFLDLEWSDGSHPANTFWPDPNTYDPNQWMEVMEAAGMKMVIMIAKHHDGFCLFQTEHTQHSLSNPNAWGGGNADVFKDVAEAARQRDIKVGLYNSPWDRNFKSVGRGAGISKVNVSDQSESEFQILPSSATDPNNLKSPEFTFSINGSEIYFYKPVESLRVFDLLGDLVKEIKVDQTTDHKGGFDINRGVLAPGLYFLDIRHPTGNTVLKYVIAD